MYAVIKNFMNGDKKVVYKTADLLQARDYAESLNEDFDEKLFFKNGKKEQNEI